VVIDLPRPRVAFDAKQIGNEIKKRLFRIGVLVKILDRSNQFLILV